MGWVGPPLGRAKKKLMTGVDCLFVHWGRVWNSKLEAMPSLGTGERRTKKDGQKQTLEGGKYEQ